MRHIARQSVELSETCSRRFAGDPVSIVLRQRLAGWLCLFALLAIAGASHAQSVAKTARRAQVEGELLVLHEDNFRSKSSHTRYYVKTGAAALELQFKGKPSLLPSGTRVRVRGSQAGNVILLDAGTSTSTSSLQVVAPALQNTFGQQSTLVLLVNFQDTPASQPWTVDQARTAVLGTVSNFIAESSYQQTSLVGDAYGWFNIPVSSSTCDSNQIATASLNAATSAGINVSAYGKRVYVFPYNAVCAWSGKAMVGGSPSDAWINGGTSYVMPDGSVNYNGPLDTGIAAHELGHTFGLYHSHALSCTDGPISGTCTSIEYGDNVDTMGGSQGHFNAFQKERMGWLNYGASPPITTVAANGTYALTPYEIADATPKALKILKGTDPSTGLSTWYYLEYRQPFGFDAFLSSLPNRVLVRIGTDSSPNSSDLLQAALQAGQTFSDAASGVTVTAVSADSSGAAVTVALAQPACTRGNPLVAAAPASQSGAAGSALVYSITVTNNDGASCSSSTLALSAAVPFGWSVAFANPSLTLSPGTSASTSATFTSSTDTAAGSYASGVTAANNAAGLTGSTSVTYQVIAGPTVVVGTDQASYTAGQAVKMTASVVSDGAPLAGAKVTFTVTPPNGGRPTTATATTGSSGVASSTYKLSRKPVRGTYAVQVVATSGGSTASGATSFIVQ